VCVCVCVCNTKRHTILTARHCIIVSQVRDLFSKAGTGPAGGLKVRMNPKSGVEVVGLTEWPVGRYSLYCFPGTNVQMLTPEELQLC